MFCYDRLSRLRQSGSNILTCLPFFLNCEDTDDIKIDLLLDWVYSFYAVVSFNAVVFSLFFKLFYKGINFWALCWYKCVCVRMRVHTCVHAYVCVRWKGRERNWDWIGSGLFTGSFKKKMRTDIYWIITMYQAVCPIFYLCYFSWSLQELPFYTSITSGSERLTNLPTVTQW